MAYIQGSQHQNGSTSATSVSVTLSSGVGIGHSLRIGIGGKSGTCFLTGLTDDKGNSYHPVDFAIDTTFPYFWQTAYLNNITNGPTTITATFNSSCQFLTILVDEYSGDAASPLDGHGIQTQQITNPPYNLTSSQVYNTSAGDSIYGQHVNTAGGALTAGTGFTQRQNVANSFLTQDGTTLSIATIASTATGNNSVPSTSNTFISAAMAFSQSQNGPPFQIYSTSGNDKSSSSPSTCPAYVQTVGDLLVLASTAVVPPTGITDSFGNTWTHYGGVQNSSTNFNIDIWFTYSVAAGQGLVTAAYGSGAPTGAGLQIMSVKGAQATNPFTGTLGTWTTSSTGGTPTGGPTVTTAAVNAIVVGVFSNSNNEQPVAGSGWTSANTGRWRIILTQPAPNTGTYQPLESPDNSDVTTAVAFALAPAPTTPITASVHETTSVTDQVTAENTALINVGVSESISPTDTIGGIFPTNVGVSEVASAVDTVGLHATSLAIDGTAAAFITATAGSCSVTLSTQNANDLILIMSCSQNEPSLSVSDAAGLTWTKHIAFASPFSGSAGSARSDVWYAISPSPLTNDVITVTYVPGGSANLVLHACGVTGANTMQPFDGVPATYATATGSPSGGAAVTTSSPSSMVIGFNNQNANQTPSPGSGWNTIESFHFDISLYGIPGVVGTYIPMESPSNQDVLAAVGFAVNAAGSFQLSESVTATDAASSVLVAPSGINEANGSADAAFTSLVASASVHDTIAPVDEITAINVSVVFSKSVREFLTVSDAISENRLPFPVSVSESVPAIDGISFLPAGTKQVSETALAIDTVTAGRSVLEGVSEAITVSDSVAYNLIFNVSVPSGAVIFNGQSPRIRVTRPIITSGQYSFAPSLGELVLYCFQRCGVARTAVTANHLTDARISANMILSDWSNEQINLWEVDLQVVDLVQGQAVYPVSGNTVLILDAYIRINAESSEPADIPLYPLSRTQYASLTTKKLLGRPTTYWFDRLLQPSITLWEIPDQSSPVYQLRYYRARQTQDGIIGEGENVEVPYRFIRAFADALAARLAAIYAPARMAGLDARASESFEKAKKRDAEDTPQFITTDLNDTYNRV